MFLWKPKKHDSEEIQFNDKLKDLSYKISKKKYVIKWWFEEEEKTLLWKIKSFFPSFFHGNYKGK